MVVAYLISNFKITQLSVRRLLSKDHVYYIISAQNDFTSNTKNVTFPTIWYPQLSSRKIILRLGSITEIL